MAGLVAQVGFIRLGSILLRNSAKAELPAIHLFASLKGFKTWMPATSAGMTIY
jgi:hypothetical protein